MSKLNKNVPSILGLNIYETELEIILTPVRGKPLFDIFCSEKGVTWNKMKNIGCAGQKVLPEDIVYFGVRDTEEPEENQIEKLGIKNYMVAEVRHRGAEVCLKEAIERLKNCDSIYLSFDVDIFFISSFCCLNT